MGKDMTKVTFEFEDGSKKIVEGDELIQWAIMCYEKSGFLLPWDTDSVLVEGFGGVVRGFVSPSDLTGEEFGHLNRLVPYDTHILHESDRAPKDRDRRKVDKERIKACKIHAKVAIHLQTIGKK